MLDELKKQAIKVLQQKIKPSRKDEEWRYSDLTLLDGNDKKYTDIIPNPLVIPAKTGIQESIDHYTIVIINGTLDKQTSYLPPKEIKCYDINEKNSSDILSKLNLQDEFNNKYHVLQNYSQATAFLVIDINTTPDKPLKIYYINNENSYSTIFINIKKEVDVKLYEQFIQYDSKPIFINKVTHIDLHDNARCKHFKQHNFIKNVQFLYSSKITCKTETLYKSYILNVGCNSYRQDIECQLQGKNASCNFYGINIGNEQQKYDVIFNVKHQNNHTYSNQHYNQVLLAKAKGSFYSKVEIPALLHKVEAHQLNKNLFLDDTAQAFTRPQLDIHSNDVICSHGATVGNIDQDAINYLKSRGINSLEAKKLIIQGFLKTVFEDKGLDQEDYQIFSNQITCYLK